MMIYGNFERPNDDLLPELNETSTEFHFPGQNYTGPGTHVIERLKRGDQPQNKTDFATLLHDIDYLRTAGRPDKQWEADKRAIRNSAFSIEGLATGIGLTTRGILGMEFNTPIKGYTSLETQVIGLRTWNWLKRSQYANYFAMYDISPEDYEY